MKNAATLASLITVSALILLYSVHKVYLNSTYTSPLIGESSFLTLPQVSQSSPSLNSCNGLKKWIVVTADTRNPTPAMLTVLNTTTNWCLLVLGFQMSRSHWAPNLNMYKFSLIYMSTQDMASLPYELVKITPYHTFNRRNIGYLYAIERGAEIILDMEGNSIPQAIYQEQVYNVPQPYKIPELYRDDAAGMQT